MSRHRNFIFGMLGHPDHTYFKFEYQGHRGKVTFVKLIILTCGNPSSFAKPIYVIDIIKVKVMLKSRSFQNQIVSVWISIPNRAVGLQPNAFLLNSELSPKL